MKKAIPGMFALVALLFFACSTGAKPAASSSAAISGGMTLDQALKEAADRIDERIAAGSKIAPLNFNSPHDKFSGYVLDEVTANLVDSGKLTVVDRKEVDLIRSEFDFQFSGEVGDDSMQKVGNMLGAQSIISGSLTDMGGFYRIVIRVLNVQSASVEVQYRGNVVNDTITAALLTGGKTSRPTTAAQRALAAATNPATQAPAPTPVAQVPAESPAPVYKIGDKGPAGGIVFYDKGNNSSGWRYLEAAPANTEFKAIFGRELETTSAELGSGKNNTQRLKVVLEERGEITRAAHRCTQLNINGYTDWFLPSRAELAWMYINLKEKGLGGFSSDWYWSSSFGRWSGLGGTFRQKFSDGTEDVDILCHQTTSSVRAVRQF